MWKLIVPLTLLLAGCIDTAVEAPEQALAEPLPVSISGSGSVRGADFTLRPVGEGMGRVTIDLDAPTSLRLVHNELDLADAFADNGTYYHVGAYTVLHVDDAAPYTFTWLGDDSGFTSPQIGRTTHGFTNIGPGSVTILFANNVPGYTIEIGDGGKEVEWKLGSQPGFMTALPPVVDHAGTNARVAHLEYERHAVMELPNLTTSLVVAKQWHGDWAPAGTGGARLGVAARSFGLYRLGTPVAAGDGSGPFFGSGAYFGGASWFAERASGDMQVAFAMKYTSAGTTDNRIGLAVVVLPLDAPAQPLK